MAGVQSIYDFVVKVLENLFGAPPPHPPAFCPWKSMVWEGMSLVYTAAAAKGLFSFGSFLAFTYFGE
jgi:hypothetical protein